MESVPPVMKNEEDVGEGAVALGPSGSIWQETCDCVFTTMSGPSVYSLSGRSHPARKCPYRRNRSRLDGIWNARLKWCVFIVQLRSVLFPARYHTPLRTRYRAGIDCVEVNRAIRECPE